VSIPEAVAASVARLPTSPGVYLMHGPGGEVIYIGKATNLRSRVRSYFTGHDPRPFVRHLDALLTDVTCVLTANAKEALLLENTLIKRHRPRFNFMLRDDKNYLSVRIDERVPWPRAELVRRIRRDGAKYFGPYASAQKARQTLNVLNRHFQLRTCTDATLHNRTRPCLQHQIGRCPAPCVLDVSRDAYLEGVRQAELFLSGKQAELVERLTQRMMEAAEAMAFEDAARYRDQRAAVMASLERQGAVQTQQADRDVVGLWREGDDAAFAVMQFRGGALSSVRTFVLREQVLPDDQTVASFLGQFYGGDDHAPPPEVLVPVTLPEEEGVEASLTELAGRRCHVRAPVRGEKSKLVELAAENARAAFAETVSTTAQAMRGVERLAKKLDLRQIPRTIECYDISNFQGAAIVASQVVFVDGVADRARFRRLRLRTQVGQDDFAAMAEVMGRRVARARGDNPDPLPDLIVVDGGRGQLAAAMAALAEAGAPDATVIALAKARVIGTDDEDATVSSSERVFLPNRKNPVLLQPNSPEWLLMTRIRDEAHRTAVTFHRSVRTREAMTGTLERIGGVGPTRRKALLSHFGSMRAIRAASLAELAAAPGVDVRTARRIYMHFHPDEVQLDPAEST